MRLLQMLLAAHALLALWTARATLASEQLKERDFHRFHSYKHSLRRPFFLSLQNASDPHGAKASVLPHFSHDGAAAPGPAGATLRLLPSVPRARSVVAATRPLMGDDHPADSTGGQAKSPYINYLTDAEGWEIELTFKMSPSPAADSALAAGGVIQSRVPGVGIGMFLTSTPIHLADSGAQHVEFGTVGPFDGIAIKIEPMPTIGNPHDVQITGILEFLFAGQTIELGSCVKPLRNAMHPSSISLTYLHSTSALTLWTDTTGTRSGYEKCFSKDNLVLTAHGWYLGLAGMNGELDHTDAVDVYSLDALALNPLPKHDVRDLNNPVPGVEPSPQPGEHQAPSKPADKPAEIDDKTLKHIKEIEERVHSMQKKVDEAAAQQAGSIPGAAGDAAVSANPPIHIPNAGSPQQLNTIAGSIHGIETVLARIETQMVRLAEQVNHLVSAVDTIRTDVHDVDARVSQLTERQREWRHSLDERVSSLERSGEARHVEVASTLARVTEDSQKAALTASASGPHWGLIFVGMVLSQAVMFAVYGWWKASRKPNKKYI